MRAVGIGFGVLVVICGVGLSGADDAPTIKSIMKTAFKDGLARKVATGEASAEEKSQLLKMSQALQKLTPPQGDAESWKELTQSVIDAAQAAVDDKPDAPSQLRKATNCMQCHGIHKPQ